MHFFNKTVGLMAILCVIPSAFAAATARPGTERISVVTTPSARISSARVKVVSSTTSDTTTTSALLTDADCISAYSACIKGPESCGENFEECTTKVLFHGKMPNCLGTLAQCSTAGINSLFGTKDVSALSKVAATNDYDEVTDYTYPTDGSVLGQMITAAAILNKYDTSTCVRRYTSCLKKDSVCGEDFELCTTDTDFRKQRVFCDSTLARCQAEGVIELLGSSNRTASPAEGSRIKQMINDGQSLAAVNSVNTCYKTVDQCILAACSRNPYRCYEDNNIDGAGRAVLAKYIEQITKKEVKPTDATNDSVLSDLDEIDKKSIRGYIYSACFTTVGANKYCHATFLNDGRMPSNAELRDPGNQEDVFELAYEARMNASMKTKIADLVDKFDEKAKEQCTDTIKSCAMRVCGGGVGPACYAQVYGTDSKVHSINNDDSYEDIKIGCEAIVNTDLYCQYSAANTGATGPYSYAYINNSAFEKLFPKYDSTATGGNNDPIGVIATLNASLAANYNDAAIAQMKKSCENVAKSCVKSMCGEDYVNCYRNRTDVYSNTYDGSESGKAFADSMNKVNGVLDYTVVLGLCVDTVKNSAACEEHLAIQKTKVKVGGEVAGWGAGKSVSDTWGTTARGITVEDYKSTILVGCKSSDATNCPDTEECGTVGETGCVYDQRIEVSYDEYRLSTATDTLFREVLADIEKEAQAKYNAKLTKEQNMCMASNAGGVLGGKDMGSTYMWVKLKGTTKVPADYNVKGLQNRFVASNDLYGSFCRVRVTLQSDDKDIQNKLNNESSWNTAYFAVGDAFTCGSWIPENDLIELSQNVAQRKTGVVKKQDGSVDLNKDQKWIVGGVTVLSTLLGGAATDVWQTEGGLGGLLKTTTTVSSNETAKRLNTCVNDANRVIAEAQNGSYAKCTNVSGLLRSLYTTVGELQSKDHFYDIILSHDDCAGYDNVMADVRADAEKVKKACEDKLSSSNSNNKGTGWNRWAGRTVVDVVGAGVTAAAGGIITAHALKDANRAQLTAEQEAWMNNVGSHIKCYIGADQAGEYGDIITTTLE